MPFNGKVHDNVLTVMEGHQGLLALLHAAEVPFIVLKFDVNEIAALNLRMMQLRLCAGLTGREDPLQGPARIGEATRAHTQPMISDGRSVTLQFPKCCIDCEPPAGMRKKV